MTSPEPMNTEEAREAEAGEAVEAVDGGFEAAPLARPDYDAREESISPERRPFGPPLEEGEPSAGFEAFAAPEEPVDPELSEGDEGE